MAVVPHAQGLRHHQQDHARLAGKAHARDGRGAQRAYHGCIHRADDAHQRALDGGGPGDGNVFFIEFFSFFVGHRLAIRARNLEKTLYYAHGDSACHPFKYLKNSKRKIEA